jgi:branched-chain amino acid transport system ATP-binding protein
VDAKDYMIAVENLVSGYGKKEILHGITIQTRPGEITGLIGRNGVGKTTLLQTVIGFLKPFGGRVIFQGENISGLQPHVIAKMGIAYVPQGKSVFPHMTVAEHLDIGLWNVRDSATRASQLAQMFALFPRLNERRGQKGGTLSGGERQMLSIARALISSPQLLLLDEPSFGLSPKMVDTVFKNIREIRERGVTIFLVEQNAHRALQLADRGYVLENGRIVREGESKELLKDDEIRKAYLGL